MSSFRHFLHFVGRRRAVFLIFHRFLLFGKPRNTIFFAFQGFRAKSKSGNHFHANEQLDEAMIRALISYGANGEHVRPKVVLLREHLAREHLAREVEAQVATVARVVARDCRPIVAEVAHEEKRAVFAVAITRSREIYGGIRTADLVIEVETGFPFTVYIEL